MEIINGFSMLLLNQASLSVGGSVDSIARNARIMTRAIERFFPGNTLGESRTVSLNHHKIYSYGN